MRARAAPVIAGLSAIAFGAAHAQNAGPSRRWDLAAGAGAMYGNLAGGDFKGTKAALGVDANVGVVLRQWQLAIGYDRTNHGRKETNGDFVVSNFYFEPRFLLTTRARRLTPYVVARLGRAMASYEGVLGITEKATGYIAGVGAGALVSIVSHVQADATVHYARLSHDYGTGGYAAAEKGERASVRLGVRLTSGR